MHHKFLVVDRKRVMTGSFNWSLNAMVGNEENVLFIDRQDITERYLSVFEKLWSKYNPNIAEHDS